ncbi:hypothetical protein ACS0TY_021203 [Phlomoides rotata]
MHLSYHADGKEADLSCVEVLVEPYFSSKLLRLIRILSNFRLQPDMKCIIFVNRIVIARSLTFILRNLKLLSSWKCDFLVGVHSGLTSRKNTDIILQKFRSGELNLLVATKVGEEGLDIQTCCLVIRFDLPETVASFIQSRGRARMLQSVYAFLVDRDNPSELDLIELFEKDEAQMNAEISSRTSHVQITDFEEKTYKVDSTSATISSVSSISLLHHYCSKLPHDEYFNPMPQFFYYDDEDGTVCSIILPANAPIHQIASSPQPSTELAKKDACLKACQELHKVGALTDYLLPEQDEKHEELPEYLSDPDGINEEESRAELHEMLVPVALRKPWTKVENLTSFSCYYIEFCPTPADREYRKFGLFVKEPLPEEAGKMKIDLCLARGRMVKSQLIPTGVAKFDKDEIAAAEMFQKMYLRVILDRHKFIPEFVSLESDDAYDSNSSTFYLLLPLVPEKHDRISVDWTVVKRCLSSPIFKQPRINVDHETSQLGNYLHLANGHLSVDDVVGSLVYVPCKAIFFFICSVFPEKNAHSLHDDSKSHVQQYNEKFGIDLAYPDQPLLQAKQLFVMDNLLRKKRFSEEWREKMEHFIELPPEICQLKVIGFSKDIGSSLSLLPSIMTRLEGLLVAIELKDKLVASFPEGTEITADRILEAITTERCLENFSLERLEVLGDAFLKLAVGRHLFLKHDALDEGQLTTKRSNVVNNSNLFKLATRKNLQVYIRDQSFEPGLFFAVGRRCPLSCTKETEESIHSQYFINKNGANAEIRCNKCHHWLYNKTVSDVLEALVGAFIVDSGFKAASAFLNWIGIEVDFSPSQIDNICSASNAFLPISNQMDVTALEKELGYKFANKGLLIQAFVHPSFNNHSGGCYQRLEFLGDAVLDYMITAYTYTVYPNLKPGHLSDLRSACVNNTSFADVAGRWSFHKFIICDSVVLREAITKYLSKIGSPGTGDGHPEEKACPKVLGDLVESYMGAIYLDSGFNLNRLWKMMQLLLDPVISISKLQFNPLRDLTELCQSYNWKIQCCSSKKDGKYTVSVKLDEGISAPALATSTSKKAAKRMASKQLFECLKAQGYKTKSASLEEVLSNSKAMKPVLIGYDETPHCGTAKSVGIKDSESGCDEKPYRIINDISTAKPVSTPSRKSPFPRKSSEARVVQSMNNNGSGIKPNGIGGTSTATAKSRLYEMCTANCWKPPVFECFQEMGPSHLREFCFKVVLEMGERPNERFEFYGAARAKKKDAAENVAQGALWYLQHQGYIWDKKRRG